MRTRHPFFTALQSFRCKARAVAQSFRDARLIATDGAGDAGASARRLAELPRLAAFTTSHSVTIVITKTRVAPLCALRAELNARCSCVEVVVNQAQVRTTHAYRCTCSGIAPGFTFYTACRRVEVRVRPS